MSLIMAWIGPSKGVVVRVALLSRLIVLTLVLLWRSLCDPYDTSARINPPCLDSLPSLPLPQWPRLAGAIERGVVWDSVYFVRIAECGYEYEQAYAFFPLLPAAMNLLARSVFLPLVPLLGYRAVLALAGYFVSNVAFVVAAVYFYRLSALILKDSKVAMRASLLFCFNPASIFYSSIYSESLYALCSLGGQFYLFCGAPTKAILLFALSGSARSNGAVNSGYFLFQALITAFEVGYKKKNVKLAVRAIAGGVLRSIIIFIPYIAFQVYCYSRICLGGDSEKLQPWCKSKVPHVYAYLQNHYWGVGFLKYFQVKQLPNFLLALPTLSLAVSSIVNYLSLLPKIFLALYWQVRQDTPTWCSWQTYPHHVDTSTTKGSILVRRKKKIQTEDIHKSSQESMTVDLAKHAYHSILVLPFIVHLGFLVFTAFFIMHVQVATRFLSASPPIYWFASYKLSSANPASTRLSYLTLVYFIAFILFGSLLFSNFYPFT